MRHLRPYVLIAIVVAIIVLTALFSHGLRVRLVWGSSGFVAGFVCGVLLTIEIRHRRKKREEQKQKQKQKQ